MYEKFYNLKERPFKITPNPDYFFSSRGHKLALDYLSYGLTNQAGFTVIIGGIGTGKTTLVKRLLRKIGDEVQLATIANANVTPIQFLQTVLQEYGLDYKSDEKISLYITLKNFLTETYHNRKKAVLIVDEAQNLSPQVLEELRMISDLQTENDHLIQIILLGQPNLKEVLVTKDMAQFAQRITASCYLKGLEPSEVGVYIRHRLNVSGGDSSSLFTGEAINKIAQHSEGIPRIINVICDAALVYGFADELSQIDDRVIDEVVESKKATGLFLPEYNSSSGEEEKTDWEKRLFSLEEDVVQIKKKIDSLILITLKMISKKH